MNFTRFFIIIYFFLTITQGSSKDKIILDRVVASVNKRAITLTELEKRFEKVKKINPDLKDKDKKNILNTILDKMIIELLINDELEREKRDVSEKEIDGAILSVKKQNNMTDDELESALTEEGKTIFEYREDLRRQLEYYKLINTEIRPNIPITDNDVEEYYKTTYLTKKPEKRVNLKILLIKVSKPPQTDEFLSKVKDEFIKDDVNILQSLSLSADDYEIFNTDELLIDDLDDDIKESVKKLTQGETSGVISGKKGYYIITLKKVSEDKTKSLDEMREDIKEELTRKKIEIEFEKWQERVKKRSYIEKRL